MVNQGLSAARNTGIDWAMNSDSQWITFIDSDDWVHPLYLEALLTVAQGNEIALTSWKEIKEDQELPEVSSYTYQIWKTRDYLFRQRGNRVWGILFRKDLLSGIRFPVGKLYEDQFFTYKILINFPSIPIIDQALYAYFYNPDGITKSKWRLAKLDLLDAIEEQIPAFTSVGYYEIARQRFLFFASKSRSAMENISKCEDLSKNERRSLCRKIRERQRNLLKQYKRFKWCSIWNRG